MIRKRLIWLATGAVLFPPLLAVFCFFLVPSALAQAEAAIAQAETRLVVDEENDVIWFIIKGQPAALLDETGLHVRESVGFGGTLTDYGTAYFDELAAAQRGKANDAE